MAAVQLIPKMQAAEAMAFTYDNLGEVIQWLGSDFYALTDGSPVNLNGSTVRSNFVNEDGTRTQPFDQCLVIAFRNRNDLAITSIGHYIIRDPVLGYRVMSPENVAAVYDAYGTEEDVDAAQSDLEDVEDNTPHLSVTYRPDGTIDTGMDMSVGSVDEDAGEAESDPLMPSYDD